LARRPQPREESVLGGLGHDFFSNRGAFMNIRRWINSLRPSLLGQHVRGPKWMPLRNRCRPVLERLEDRLPPAAGLASSNQQLLSAYGQLPLSFEANQGQTAAQVQYFTHSAGGTLFLTSNSAVLTLQSNNPPIDKTNLAPFESTLSTQRTAVSTTGVALALNLVGANPNAAVVGLDKLPGISNYFIGNDPSQWHTNVPNFSKVEYQNVYPGINLVYYGNQQQLEYDYQLAPGADPSSIRFAVQGADSLSLDANGNLVLHTAIGNVLEHAPVIYQQVASNQQPVSGQFVILDNNEVGFQVGAYDATRPLVIDPVLSYSTYLGGNSSNAGDQGRAIAADNLGDAYVVGNTNSTTFPTTLGAFQTSNNSTSAGSSNVFVTKLNASGTGLLYSTYLGGDIDSQGYGIAVDGLGNAYVTGTTASTNFPTTSGAFQTSNASSASGTYDAFVTKLNSTGTALIYSSYLGGGGGDAGTGIAVDGANHAYVTGYAGNNFPTTSGAFQTTLPGGAFVTKLNTTGTALVYSTYLGGSAADSGTDTGQSIAVDTSGSAYITGYTDSVDFPTTTGAFTTVYGGGGQAFVTKLNPTGAFLVYSTFLGGSESGNEGNGIAVDNSGCAYVAGYTDSTGFPTTTGALQTNLGGLQDAFVTKLNATGNSLAYSTYLGGGQDDFAYAITVDNSGCAYVTGYTESTSFPTSTDAYQNTYDGNRDVFVSKVNASGSALIYSTYFGGGQGNGIAADGFGNAYVTGATQSSNFPTTTGAYQSSNVLDAGYSDTFVVKFSLTSSTTTALTDNGPNPSNYGDAVSFTATVSGGSDTDGETVFIEDADAANAVVASPTLSGGAVTFTISDLTFGTHDLFAVYNGDDNNAGSNSSTTPVTQVVNAIPPVVASVVVNGGTPQYADQLGMSFSLAGQNSVVEQLLVTFNEPVTLAPGAFSILANIPVTVNSGPMPNTAEVDLNAPIQVGDGHQWIVTFANSAGTRPNGYGAYLIDDGVYTLHIDHTKVTADSQTMAADSDTGFWALYGDTTYHHISGVDLNVGTGYIGDGYSDASVGTNDFAGFKSCYNADATNYYAPPNYNVEYDYNLDGSDGASDFIQFKANYNADWQF
jgi:Bacterial Ig-like domain (group 3)/Beta-propeller repeat